MNILVFSDSAWDDTNSLGNTLSNFFCGEIWCNDKFYNIYTRNANPNNHVCKNYFRMTVFDMVKNYFSKEKIGSEFNLNGDTMKNIDKKINNEKKYIDFLHKYSLNFIYVAMDFIYRRKKWLNNKFKNYVKKTNLDIFFAFLTNVSILNPVIEYVKKNTNAKIVLFIADDVYGSYKRKSFIRKRKLLKEFENIMANSDLVYGISNELCDEYSKLFSKKVEILLKGCDLSLPLKAKSNKILKFVYAGNLKYGRDIILENIGKAIDSANKEKCKAILEIYTADTITDSLKDKLNISGSSMIVGKRSYEEIKEIENSADLVLHVESFEKKQIDLVKYSFSTKITDCMQCGSVLLGVGPKEVSSIKYIKKIPGSYIIDNIENIDTEIKNIIENKNKLVRNSKKIRDYALLNHEILKNQKRMRNSLLKL